MSGKHMILDSRIDQLKHLIFTHGHPDHIGSAAGIVRETGARTYMHPLDILVTESGDPFRPLTAAPGLLGRVLCKLLYYPEERMDPVAIDEPLNDGEILPIAGGIDVIHSPGHCAGQVALLWCPGRMLFAGDVCTNIMGLGDPVGFESLEEGRASQRTLASLSFVSAGFGHGGPIVRNASTRFRNKWGRDPLFDIEEPEVQRAERNDVPLQRRQGGKESHETIVR